MNTTENTIGWAWDYCGNNLSSPVGYDEILCPEGFVFNGTVCVLGEPEPDSCCKSPNSCVGNPVEVGQLYKHQLETDYSSNNYPFVFQRYYTSRPFVQTTRLGHSWRHTFDRSVATVSNAGLTSASAYRPDGTIVHYALTGGVWTPSAKISERLIELTDGGGNRTGWEFHLSGDVIEDYDAGGRLVSIRHPNGHIQTLSYDGLGVLQNVTTNMGESLTFSYNANGKLSGITDHAGRTWGYRYDPVYDYFEFVDNPDGTTRQYHYEQGGAFRRLMTGVTDERNIRYATFDYTLSGLATATYHAGNVDRVDLASFGGGTHRVLNSKGVSSIYTIAVQNGAALVTDVSGPGCSTCGTGNCVFRPSRPPIPV